VIFLNVVLFVSIIIIIGAFTIIVTNNKPEDMGCNMDCKSCPFPECTQEEKERMIKCYDIYNR